MMDDTGASPLATGLASPEGPEPGKPSPPVGGIPSARPHELLDAIGELALAIAPHNMDTNQRLKIKRALTVLVDHILEIGGRQ